MDDEKETYEFSYTKCNFEKWMKFDTVFECKLKREVPMMFVAGQAGANLRGEVEIYNKGGREAIRPP